MYPVMIKWLEKDATQLWKIFNKAWSTNRILIEWENNLIIPVYKRGDKTS